MYIILLSSLPYALSIHFFHFPSTALRSTFCVFHVVIAFIFTQFQFLFSPKITISLFWSLPYIAHDT